MSEGHVLSPALPEREEKARRKAIREALELLEQPIGDADWQVNGDAKPATVRVTTWEKPNTKPSTYEIHTLLSARRFKALIDFLVKPTTVQGARAYAGQRRAKMKAEKDFVTVSKEMLIVERKRRGESQAVFARRFRMKRSTYATIEQTGETSRKAAETITNKLRFDEKLFILPKIVPFHPLYNPGSWPYPS